MEKTVKRLLDTESQLNQDLVQEVKDYCKISNNNVTKVFRLIWKQLNRKHAQIRFNCLLIFQQLFPRSNQFQNLLCKNSEEFLELCLGSQLPEPMQWAKKLERKVIDVITDWYNITKTPRIISLYQLMVDKITNKVFLDQLYPGSNPYEMNRKIKANELRLEKYLDWFMVDIPLAIPKIQEYTTQLESLLVLLVPNDANDTPEAGESIMNHGLGSMSYSIEINLEKPVIVEDDENRILFDSLRENRKLLLSFQVKLDEWLDVTTKVDDPDLARHERNLKTLIDIKVRLGDAIAKSNDILLNAVVENDSDDDEEFEEVNETSTSLAKVKAPVPMVVTQTSAGLKPVFEQVAEDIETDVHEETTQKNPRLEKLYAIAPTVPFDQDLEYWSTSNVTFGQVSSHSGLEYHHRFLGDSSDKPISDAAIQNLRKRMVYVKNDDVVEYPPCRAPLRNGRLCPRRDAEKCPFHGIIVPRDEFGIPLDGIPTNPPKQKQTWELIAGDIVVERPKRSKTKLEPIVKKSSVQKRLLRKSNRLSKNAPVDPTPDYVERDRNAFRW